MTVELIEQWRPMEAMEDKSNHNFTTKETFRVARRETKPLTTPLPR